MFGNGQEAIMPFAVQVRVVVCPSLKKYLSEVVVSGEDVAVMLLIPIFSPYKII